MNENKREGIFIPCGDSLEKMEEIKEGLENVVGGSAVGSCYICGGRMQMAFNKETNLFDKIFCKECGWEKP